MFSEAGRNLRRVAGGEDFALVQDDQAVDQAEKILHLMGDDDNGLPASSKLADLAEDFLLSFPIQPHGEEGRFDLFLYLLGGKSRALAQDEGDLVENRLFEELVFRVLKNRGDPPNGKGTSYNPLSRENRKLIKNQEIQSKFFSE